jgi:hypothetical protein
MNAKVVARVKRDDPAVEQSQFFEFPGKPES